MPAEEGRRRQRLRRWWSEVQYAVDLRCRERISAAAVDLRCRDEREDEELGFSAACRMKVIL